MACLAEQDLTKAGEGQTSLANLSHLPLSQHLIAAITKLLDSKNVPNVLWGSFLGIVYGVIWRGGVRYPSLFVYQNIRFFFFSANFFF